MTAHQRLEDLYDGATIEALDRRRQSPRRAGRPAAVALTTALLTGTANALEDAPPEPEIAEVDLDRGDRRNEAVTVVLVPGAPRLSLAIVRPWLLPPQSAPRAR